MVNLNDIHSMTGFLRNHKAHLDRLSTTGRPEVLTVNGEARVVVQDVAAYQKMLDALDYAETVQILRERMAAIDAGEPGIPAEQVFAEMRDVVNGKTQ